MNPVRKWITGASLVGASLVAGGFGAAAMNSPASAATDTSVTTTAPSTSTGSATNNQGTPPDPSQGGHVGANGTKEVVLTGDTAEKVKAAALAANPGGTIQRVETDAEGATYEAHMTKADGTQVTVKLDASFNVTSTETGMR